MSTPQLSRCVTSIFLQRYFRVELTVTPFLILYVNCEMESDVYRTCARREATHSHAREPDVYRSSGGWDGARLEEGDGEKDDGVQF